MNGKEVQETNRLLRLIAGLLVQGCGEKPLPLKEKIAVLGDLGVTPSEIADILGRSSNYINKELSQLRKKSKK